MSLAFISLVRFRLFSEENLLTAETSERRFYLFAFIYVFVEARGQLV